MNVRTVNQCGQLENIKKEMNRLNVNVLGICKMRQANNGDFIIDKNNIIYAGGEKKKR